MPLTRIDSAFLDLDALGGIDFDVQSGVPTLKVDATNHRVGIGINSPTQKLDVGGNVNISSGNNYLVNGSQISTANVAENGSYLYHTSARAISAVTGSALDMGSNNITTTGKILFANMYSAEGDLPSASTYHGMFAHVHGTGKAYFAHGGNWIKLLDENGGSTGSLNIDGNVASTTQFSGFDALRIHNANGAAFGITADMYFTVGTATTNRGAAIGVEYSTSTGNDLYFATNPGSVTNSDTLEERLRITSGGLVGIGLTNPGDYYPQSDDLVVGTTSGNRGISVVSATTGTGSIVFADGVGNFENRRGQIVYDHSTDSLELFTDQTERLRITSGGNLGVGNDGSFPIYTGTNDRTLILGTGSEDSAIQIHSGTSNYGGLYFGDATSGSNRYRGYIEFKHGTSDDFLRFGTAATERLRITSGGAIKLNDNNIEPTGAGANVSTTYNNASWEKIVFDASYNTSPIGPNKIILQNDPAGAGWYAGFGIASNELSIYSGGNTVFYQGFNTAGAINESLRITPGGDVGIGDNAPNDNYGTNLSVHSTATDGARLKLSDGTTGKGNLDGLDIISTGGVAYFLNRENAAMSFSTGGGGSLLLSSDGMLGIGMTPSTAGSSTYMLQMYNSGAQCFMSLGNGTSGNGPNNGLVIGNDANHSYIWNRESTTIQFGVADNEKMRLHSNGTLTIGRGASSDPNRYIQIHNKDAASSAYLQSTNTGTGSSASDGIVMGMGDAVNAYFWNYEAGGIIFATSATERLRITSGGLLDVSGGIHVTENVTPTSGRGVEIFEAAAGVGQVQSYNRNGNSWDELRLKGSEISMHAGGAQKIYVQSSSTSISGTTDGVLNIDTTDSRGSFIRFKENGTTKAWVGCAEGIGTLGDQDDLGLRAVDKIIMKPGGNAVYLGPYDAPGSYTSAANNVPYEIKVAPYGWQHHSELAAISMGNHSGATGNDDGQIVFKTATNVHSDTTGLVERLRIAEDGIARFQNATGDLKIASTTGNDGGKIYLQEITTDAWSLEAQRANGSFYIRDEYNNKERFSISNTGNTGIGLKLTLKENTTSAFSVHTNGANGYFRLIDEYDAVELLRFHGDGALSINTTSLTNYSQTNNGLNTNNAGGAAGNWSWRRDTGAVIQATDADSGWALMYLNKYEWNSGDDARWISFYLNGAVKDTINWNGSNIIYGQGSDYRIKENIREFTNGIDKVKQLKVHLYDYIDPDRGTDHIGFIAHELQEIIPESVSGEKDGMRKEEDTGNDVIDIQMVDYGKLTPVLTAALQEALAKIEALEARVNSLENP